MTLGQQASATNVDAPLRYVLLGDVCKTTSGGTPSRGNPAYFDGTIPWVKSGELPDGPVADIQETITEAALANSSAKLFPAGTLLIALYGATVGKLGILTRDAATNQAVCAVFPSSVLEQKYLFWFLRFKRRALIESAIGGAQPNISQGILRNLEVPLPTLDAQRIAVAEIEKQFSRLDEAVANLKRVKANLQRFSRATVCAMTLPESFGRKRSGTLNDFTISLDNMRKPVNKKERAHRLGSVPYLGANGRTGWIDKALFDEELVLVVEDETFVGRQAPFSYYFAGECWVNNHTHVLRAKTSCILPKYLNLALSYYPFIPLTTGSTGRRKLTKRALMSAPLTIPSLDEQGAIIAEVDRRLSLVSEVETQTDANLIRAERMRQAILAKMFGTPVDVVAEEEAA